MNNLHYDLLLILSLLFAVFVLCVVSEKLHVSVPVFLVIGGLLISLIPRIPHVAIDPELIFLIILPPLLYDAAWNTSWHNFWKRRRTISLLAFGLVFFTSVVLAFFSKSLIPGFTLALGFLLGGIVSPTDAVSAVAILKGKTVPKRVGTVLEGESLVNDAASLIVFRFALAAILTGQFSVQHAVFDFLVVTVMGVVIGLGVAVAIYYVYRLTPDNPDVDTALNLLTPYIMYLVAEHFKCSGVMSVVCGGLFLSSRSHDFLRYDSRIQANNVWSTVRFLLNGAVFILIGLQLPIVIAALDRRDALGEAVVYGLVVSLIAVVVRIAWVYPAVFLPRLLSKRIRARENSPGWGATFLIGWSGMRGVVSMASALAIPLTMNDGVTPFYFRNLILFITFTVILFTLVFQGLTLSFIIKKLKLKEFDENLTKEMQEQEVRNTLIKAALGFLNAKYKDMPPKSEFLIKLKFHAEDLATLMNKNIEHLDSDENKKLTQSYNLALLDVIAMQRKELVTMRRNTAYDHELLRKHELLLDIEESRINIEVTHAQEVIGEMNR